ncbi:MAG: tRNA (guanosine(46)-N7)-methyltransferase TrmB [Bacteroidaceae bacterium]|nr:tRNA (guanosine(46)-N7)-methyltransferase TrmB [Bacteroidaceae bacterium]
MGKGKLAKFAEMAALPNVVEIPFPLDGTDVPLRGRWAEDFFRNDRPVVLELGCGRGEYTVGLARRFPDKNFIGVDIKGARMWSGATEAHRDGLANAGFLRTRIEFIDRLFAPGEVSELWLTFSDPQMKKATKRLTGTGFLERYRRFLRDGAAVHVKTDSNFLYTYTRLMCEANALPVDCALTDIYTEECDPALREIQTYYEQMWLSRGIPIKYLRFRLPHEGALREPEAEIPLDSYRSYNRYKRSGKDTGV